MTPTERTGDRRAELYVQETLPAPAARQRARLRNRLDVLEREGHVDGFDVYSCPKRIRCENPSAVAARDRYLAFAQWALERGLSLAPSFQTRECYAMDTGQKVEWLVFPAIALAVSDDGELVAVYPHADGDDYRSVADGLTALAEADGDDPVADPTAPPTTAD